VSAATGVAVVLASAAAGLFCAIGAILAITSMRRGASPRPRDVAVVMVATGVVMLLVISLFWPDTPASPVAPGSAPTTYGPPPMYVGELP
jgi:hypothetical protein